MKQKTLALALIASVLMSACGSASKAPTAAPAMPPPTAIPIPSTATPAPKPAAASNSDVTQVLTEALSKTREAKSYASKIMITGKGEVFPGVAPTNNEEEVVLLVQTSKFDGANSSTEAGGLSFKVMKVDSSVVYLTLDGTIYIKGPAAWLGAPEDKWYVVPADRAKTIKLSVQAMDLLKGGAIERGEVKDYTLANTEEIDGQSCQVYAANPEALLKRKGVFAEPISDIDTAASRIAVCADGYVHEVSISTGGKLKNDPTKRGLITMNIRLSDFSKSFVFEAPKDPVPLQAPSFAGDMDNAVATSEATPKITGATTHVEYPLPDDAKVITSTGGTVILESGLSVKDALAFYREGLSTQGLKENKQLTVESDAVFSLVMQNLPGGAAIVVQGVKIDDKKTTITIRAEPL